MSDITEQSSSQRARPGQHVLLAGAILLLGMAVMIQSRSLLRTEIYPRTIPLSALLPSQIAGWTVVDEPVASSEEVKRAVEWGLNFDEAIVRTYRRGADRLSVYVAYWSPGRFPPRLVAQHTPDYCWTGVGWDMRNLGALALELPNGNASQQAQYREFRRSGQKLFVAYWHLVGGRLSGFAQGAESASQNVFDNWWQELRLGSAEQYFIRIAASEPLPQFPSDSPLPVVLERLRLLGLAERALK